MNALLPRSVAVCVALASCANADDEQDRVADIEIRGDASGGVEIEVRSDISVIIPVDSRGHRRMRCDARQIPKGALKSRCSLQVAEQLFGSALEGRTSLDRALEEPRVFCGDDAPIGAFASKQLWPLGGENHYCSRDTDYPTQGALLELRERWNGPDQARSPNTWTFEGDYGADTIAGVAVWPEPTAPEYMWQLGRLVAMLCGFSAQTESLSPGAQERLADMSRVLSFQVEAFAPYFPRLENATGAGLVNDIRRTEQALRATEELGWWRCGSRERL